MKTAIKMVINVCVWLLVGIGIELVVYRAVTRMDINLNELVGYQYYLQCVYVILLISYGVKQAIKERSNTWVSYKSEQSKRDGWYLLQIVLPNGTLQYETATYMNKGFIRNTNTGLHEILRYQYIKPIGKKHSLTS